MALLTTLQPEPSSMLLLVFAAGCAAHLQHKMPALPISLPIIFTAADDVMYAPELMLLNIN